MKYSKHPKHNFLPILSQQNTQRKHLLQKQVTLTEQVSQLNQILHSDHLHFINNFIFTSQVKNRLSSDIMECINKQHRLLAYGFQLIKGDYDHNIIKRNIIVNTQSFKSKLHQISIKSVEKYQYQKYKHLSKLYQSRWKVTSKVQQRVHKRIRQRQAHLTSNTQLEAVYNYETVKKILTEGPDPANDITDEDISKLLKKFKNVITIWLPPKTYPQFYGIIVPSVSLTNSGPRCRIKRYIFFKQGLNQQLFTAILEYVRAFFNTNIISLEMIMTKANYVSYFKNCGWEMKSWEGVDKIYASFPQRP